MIVQRISILDGKQYEMDLPIKPEDLVAYLDGKGHVQDLFPYLFVETKFYLKQRAKIQEPDQK